MTDRPRLLIVDDDPMTIDKFDDPRRDRPPTRIGVIGHGQSSLGMVLAMAMAGMGHSAVNLLDDPRAPRALDFNDVEARCRPDYGERPPFHSDEDRRRMDAAEAKRLRVQAKRLREKKR
jgi:hypothetical protein